LASERHGWYAEFFDYVDDLDSVERDPLLGSLVSELSADRLWAAIEASTEGTSPSCAAVRRPSSPTG
jgi:hypothetical protein